ncbi:MAG: hypothetical protein KGL55_15665, partial [Rhodospirillales bacterium]|nr:hypothetical protein [Rhodospirillales bacterium]
MHGGVRLLEAGNPAITGRQKIDVFGAEIGALLLGVAQLPLISGDLLLEEELGVVHLRAVIAG